MIDAVRTVDVLRVRDRQSLRGVDWAATEEPLEVRLHTRPFAVIMRTPGADRELTAGFLLSERVLLSPDDLGSLEHCRDATGDGRTNVVNATLTGASAGQVELRLAERRQVPSSTSCGMCGRQSIESVTTGLPCVTSPIRVTAAFIAALPDRLRAAQTGFDASGGLHAAGLFTAAGGLDAVAEDVGRHNAVDKVVGAMVMRDALPLSGSVLFVSGRVSFEIVQKAFAAGVPIVAAVSAPSTLAIQLAEEAGITLAAFVRDGGFNVYAHPERILET